LLVRFNPIPYNLLTIPKQFNPGRPGTIPIEEDSRTLAASRFSFGRRELLPLHPVAPFAKTTDVYSGSRKEERTL
jgi:hypothetical protein